MATSGEVLTQRESYPVFDWLRKAFTFLRRWPVVPIMILTVLLVSAVFAPLLAPHDPLKQNLRARTLPPFWLEQGTSTYPLGTDQWGSDVLSRMMYGARISLMVASIGVTVGLLVGTTMGLIAGYFGGLVDEIIMRLVDMWLALPFLMIAFIVAVIVGPSLVTITWLLALSSWSAGARNVRAEVLHLKTLDYVSLARVAGASDTRILLKHILPQVSHILIVVTTLRTGSLIIAESGLSFLGVGVPASTPTWGIMIAQGQQYLLSAWWIAIFPGVALFLTVMSFNFLGDWLRDRFDPRLRQL